MPPPRSRREDRKDRAEDLSRAIAISRVTSEDGRLDEEAGFEALRGFGPPATSLAPSAIPFSM